MLNGRTQPECDEMKGTRLTRGNLTPSSLRGRGFIVPGAIVKRSPTNYAVKVYIGQGKSKWYSGFRTRREAQAFQANLASHPAHSAGVGLYGSVRERTGTYLKGWFDRQEGRVKAGNLRPKTLAT